MLASSSFHHIRRIKVAGENGFQDFPFSTVTDGNHGHTSRVSLSLSILASRVTMFVQATARTVTTKSLYFFLTKIELQRCAWSSKVFCCRGGYERSYLTMKQSRLKLATFADQFIQCNRAVILHQTRLNHRNTAFALYENLLLKNPGWCINFIYKKCSIYNLWIWWGWEKKPERKSENWTKDTSIWLPSPPPP